LGVLRFCPDLYTDDFSSRRGGGDGGGVKLHISIWKNSRWNTNLIRGAFFSSSTGKLKKSTKQVTFEKG